MTSGWRLATNLYHRPNLLTRLYGRSLWRADIVNPRTRFELEGADDGSGDTAGAERGRSTTRGGALPRGGGLAAYAGPGLSAGGRLARGGGAGGRHGPADAPGLGAPLQRGRAPRAAGPAPVGAQAAPHTGARSRAGDGRGPGARSGPRRRGALAAGRPEGVDRGALRGHAARALGRQAAASARLRPPVGAPAAPAERPRGAGRVQKTFAGLVREALPERARGKPIEVWFQDEARVGQQGTLARIWARRGSRP